MPASQLPLLFKPFPLTSRLGQNVYCQTSRVYPGVDRRAWLMAGSNVLSLLFEPIRYRLHATLFSSTRYERRFTVYERVMGNASELGAGRCPQLNHIEILLCDHVAVHAQTKLVPTRGGEQKGGHVDA